MNNTFPYIVIEEPDGTYHLSHYGSTIEHSSITPYTQVILPQIEPINVPTVQINISDEPDPTSDRCMACFSFTFLILFAVYAFTQIIHSYSSN